MIIRDIVPHPAVKEFVQCYRIVHFEFDTPENIPFKAYAPKPEQCLHFFLRDPLAIETGAGMKIILPPCFLTGQSTSLVKRYNGMHLLNVQIVFQPMAVYRLTGIPSGELCNQHLDASDIFTNIPVVAEQLKAATNYRQLADIIHVFALQLVQRCCKNSTPVDLIGREMLSKPGVRSLDWFAKEACLSIRQFRRKFYDQTGVNPKTFLKIIDFNKTFNYKNRYPTRNWSAIAAACGYTDYQHLARAYKEFTGLTPFALHDLENNAPENVLGLSKRLYHDRYRLTHSGL